ncbi:MAG TPA: DEAD/DEAH box helicase family protein [Candidatus Avamphibacillus sp.]|nr:DEAD/DEAH box helicase family protein [Candidatus Avamphibacillus sp.]
MHDYEQLQNENLYLKKIIAKLMQKLDIDDFSNILTKRSPLSERIYLLKDLFQGRSDVYAIRFENKDGKKGYRPARTFNSRSQNGDKSRQSRGSLPLTKQVLIEHISGKKTVGIYPLLKNGTCHFLVIDFDKGNWKKDVTAFSETCRVYHIPYHIERSRSGDGAHIWIFFAKAVLAKTARELGMLLLKKTKKRNATFTLDSFDRLFPNQDVLPEGGFGNLIALPLQRNPGLNGNSLFVDRHFIPYPDQWMYLSTVQKLGNVEVRNIIRILGSDSNANERMPKEVNFLLKSGIHVEKKALPPSLVEKINSIVSFSNPNYFKARQNRFSVKNIPRVIQCMDETADNLILPRGCLNDLLDLFNELSIKVKLIDERFQGETIQEQFHGILSVGQEEALEKLQKHQYGVLAAATGFGKTVVAASMITRRRVNTLVIVHRTQLLQQWKEKLAAFLDIPISSIGQIGGGKHKPTGIIDIATIQSLNYSGKLKSIITQYGHIIVDECHVISAVTFEAVLKKIRPKFILGLTATPKRKDGMHPIIKMQCGPIRYQTNARLQAQIRPFIHCLIPRKTSFTTKETDFRKICEELVLNKERNARIFDDVLQSLEAGRSPIILTNRILHLKMLTKMFQGFTKNMIVLAGNQKKKELNLSLERLSKIPEQEERLIIATGKYIGEGFDDARLDTLFLTMPISWKGMLHQYVGRLHRLHEHKQEVQVYDYVDEQVPILKDMYSKRLKGYKALGYLNRDEGSASEQMRLF